MINFSTLAKLTNAERTYLKGLVLPMSTLLTFVGLAALMATGSWLWGGMLATASTLWSTSLISMAGIVGLSGLNYWFAREINAVNFGAAEVYPGELQDHEFKIDLVKMVDHLCAELDAHYKTSPMPRPRIATFTEHHHKIIGIPGRNAGRAALYISSGALSAHETNLSPKQLAVLLMLELDKVRSRRGMGYGIVGVGMEFMRTLDNLIHAKAWYVRALGVLLGPAQLLLFVQKGLARAYTYEACKTVVACGRGNDLKNALDHLGNPNRLQRLSGDDLHQARQHNARRPYNQELYHWLVKSYVSQLAMVARPIDALLKPLSDWVDANEWVNEDKNGYRLLSFFDIGVRELGNFFKEAHQGQSRGVNLKRYIAQLEKQAATDNASFQIIQHDLSQHNKQYPLVDINTPELPHSHAASPATAQEENGSPAQTPTQEALTAELNQLRAKIEQLTTKIEQLPQNSAPNGFSSSLSASVVNAHQFANDAIEPALPRRAACRRH